jgi:serine/threonine-protein kinase
MALKHNTGDEEISVSGYEILSKIGEGGLGAVYKARQLSMDRIVALKVFHEKWVQDEEFKKRFILEARLVGKLSHPNLITIYDVGKENGKYYFSMELVEGESVEDILNLSQKMEPARAISIIIQIAKAINYLKEHEIVHCDMKPGNILISRDGGVKLGDFGFVRIGMELARPVGQPIGDGGTVLGTPEYISPEQAMGKKRIDFRSDIYSLGISLFHMVTGKPPYDGDSTIIMRKHVKGEMPDPRTINPHLGREICAILKKMTALDPNDRYQTVEELIKDLTIARLAEDPHSPEDVTLEESTVLSALKRERHLAQKYSEEASELKESAANYKLYFFLAVGVLALSVILNIYLFLRILEK